MEPKHAIKVYETVIDYMKLYTRKEVDDLYADVLTETIRYFPQDKLTTIVIPQALEFCNCYFSNSDSCFYRMSKKI